MATYLQAWATAARLHTLPSAITAVLLGGIPLAWEAHPQLWRWAGCLVIAVAVQIAGCLASEADDAQTGARTPQQGAQGAISAGVLSILQLRIMAMVWLLLAGAAALWVVPMYRTELWILGGLAALAAITFTSRPALSYGYWGLGEPIVGFFFGPVAVLGTAAIVAQTLGVDILLMGIAAGAMTVAVFVINSLRDEHSDRQIKKKTFVVRYGAAMGGHIYYGAMMTAMVATAMVGAIHFWAWGAAIVLLLWGGRLNAQLRQLIKAEGASQMALLHLQQRTAILQLVWAIALALGVLIPR